MWDFVFAILVALGIFWYIVSALYMLGIHIASDTENKYLWIVFLAFVLLPVFKGMDFIESKYYIPEDED